MDVDAVVYVDSDVLFLRPLEDLWQLFYKFNMSQIAATAPESEDPRGGWYSQTTIPYVPRVPPSG
jgi:UDP-xylose:glucoside alpha-1,3-xylosyltransferase